MLGSAPTLRAVLALSLSIIGLALAAPAAGAQGGAPDTATATGHGDFYTSVDIQAHSKPSGADAGGSGRFTVFGALFISGPVTCLSVTGPDQGAGTPTAPTQAILNIQDPGFGIVTVVLIDNGGNGADIMSTGPTGRRPSNCSPIDPEQVFPDTLTHGRAVVFDAPLVPTTKADCKHGGWRDFGSMFRNQGQCVAFVNHQRHKGATG
jgi:hypothetical protein